MAWYNIRSVSISSRGIQIIIPEKQRQKTLGLACEGNLGIVGMRKNLGWKVWWPGIDKDAEKYCRSCYGCQLVAQPSNPEPMNLTELPEGPRVDLIADIRGPRTGGESLLVLVDYYSRFYEVFIGYCTFYFVKQSDSSIGRNVLASQNTCYIENGQWQSFHFGISQMLWGKWDRTFTNNAEVGASKWRSWMAK